MPRPGPGAATSCDSADAVDYPDGGGDLNALLDEGNGFSPGRQDHGTLDAQDPGFDDAQSAELNFFDGFTAPGLIPNTTRHVEPRNTPTIHNSIFNLRNFWDGRADMFFNGVNPLGFRDPEAMVTVFNPPGAAVVGLTTERMNVPFSSLASQAIGPIESVMEMVGHTASGGGRPNHNLGRKMVEATPLLNQKVACTDPLLGVPGHSAVYSTTCSGGTTGLVKDTVTYRALIQDIFDNRFWGTTELDGSGLDVCLGDADGFTTETFSAAAIGASTNYCGVGGVGRLLIEKNFQIFFGLAIQAWEATQTPDETIIDLLAGGVIGFDTTPGNGSFRGISTVIINRSGRTVKTVDVGNPFVVVNRGRPNAPVPDQHLTLAQCIAAVAINNSAAQAAIAEDLCTLKYAQFIHARAESGTESNLAPFPPIAVAAKVPPGAAIGKCNPPDTFFDGNPATPKSLGLFLNGDDCKNAQATILNIDRGLGRFEAGATACIVCHFSAEFTGATVPTLTGFGAPPPDPFIPPGQLARAEVPALTERMVKFDGAAAVYDAGFYNLGIRPTPEDLSIGATINVGNGNFPLSLAELKKQITIVTAAAAGLDGAAAAAAADAAAPDRLDGSAILDIGRTINGLTGPGRLQFPRSMQVGTRGVTDLSPVPFALTLACGPGLNANGLGEPNNVVPNCVPNIAANEFILRNGAFKAQGLRNVRFTGPHFHNGSKMNLRQVFNFYRTAGDLVGPTAGFPNLNLANLDAGLRIVNLAPDQESAVIEAMETGLTDWASVYEQGKFSHPQLCVAVGHNAANGKSIMKDLHVSGAVGAEGAATRLQTFEEGLFGEASGTHSHDFSVPCEMPGVATLGLSTIDVPPQ